MYYNGQKGYHVATFLNMVHGAMEVKYSSQRDQSTADAKELQNFFQELKYAAQHRDEEDFIQNDIINLILDNIEAIGKSKNKKYNIKNLFGVRGGIRFENEIAKVIEAVYQEVANDNFEFDTTQVTIGSKGGTTVNLSQIVEKDTQRILKSLGTKTQRKIEDNNKKNKKMFYLADVSGKIDVKGYEIEIKADIDPKILRIYNLLSQATFSAKSYDSMSWDEKTKTFVESIGHNYITLGHSNLYRAIAGSLGSLGYDDKTIASAFWAGYNKVNQGDKEVANHFYHLRYIYELAGSGITYNGKSFGEVKYLIYNDPHGNIYVKSTAEILSDVLNNHPAFTGNPFSGISISKSSFK